MFFICRQEDYLDVMYRCYEYMVLMDGSVDGTVPVVSSLREVISSMHSTMDQKLVPMRGRPRIDVDSNQLAWLVENGFLVKDISEIMHCSKRTIERGRLNKASELASIAQCQTKS